MGRGLAVKLCRWYWMMLHPLLVISRLLSVPTFTTPPGTDGLSTPEFERPMISMLIKGRALLDRVKVGKEA